MNDLGPVSKAYKFWEAEQLHDPDRIMCLEVIADAAREVRKVASVMACYGIEDDRSDYVVEIELPAGVWEALADALNALDNE